MNDRQRRIDMTVKKALSGAMTTCFIVLGLLGAASVAAQTIVDEWSTAKAPPAPELKPVAITNLKETALFILDIQKQTCNPERRPRCIASVPKIRKLLAEARAKGMPVLHATSTGKIADILPEVPPREGEPVVHSGPNKFTGTDLEKILKDRGIKTLVMVGTAAHGAVVYTASEAAFRGFKVVVPVDGMSAESIYIEQYVTYQLVNGPRLGPAVTLTKFDLLKF